MAKTLVPSVCVAMASYNGEAFIAEQLESLYKQSYQNFSVIVVDDASTDNTVNIIKSFMDKLQIELIQNETNLGYIKNFEKALSLAKADYIAPCDQDDLWTADKLQILVENIQDASLIYSNSELIDANGNSLHRTLSQKLKNNFISTHSPLSFTYDNCVSAHAMLFKKELLSSIFPFPETLYFDAWIASNAASINGVKYIDKCLVLYRQHTSNTLSITSKKEKVKTSKSEKKSKEHKTSINMIKDLLHSPVLSHDDEVILKQVLRAHEKFFTTWFNPELFFLLLRYGSEFFSITSRFSLLLCFKKSIGFKSYKLFPFL